jgi:FkbM family methyltransferase
MATPPEQDFVRLLHADRFRYVADLGAYTGDSLRELMTYAPGLQGAVAMEPDARTFRRLSRFAQELADAGHGPVIHPVPKGAWSGEGMLTFSGTGNRNASLVSGTDTVQAHAAAVAVDTLDAVWDQVMGRDTPVDFIKYDVEGAEAEALRGSYSLILRYAPALLVSVYHRSADLFTLPLLVHQLAPHHALYLRRWDGVPAWDINLYAVPFAAGEA